MTAAITNVYTGQPTDMELWPLILDGNGPTMSQIVTAGRTAGPMADVDLRAEFRAWSSYPRAMAVMTGKAPERDAAPTGRIVAIGGFDGGPQLHVRSYL